MTLAIVIDKIYNFQILVGVKDDYGDYFLKTEQWKIIHFRLYLINLKFILIFLYFSQVAYILKVLLI